MRLMAPNQDRGVPDPHPLEDAQTLALGLAHVVNQEGYVRDGLFDQAHASVLGGQVHIKVAGKHYRLSVEEV